MTIIVRADKKDSPQIYITQDVITRKYGAYAGKVPSSCKVLVKGVHPTAVDSVLGKLNSNARLKECNKLERWWKNMVEK